MKKNKLLAVLLALAMTLSLLPTAAMAEEMPTENTSTKWEDSAVTSWYDNDPNSEQFTITTAAELAGLAKLVNSGTTTFSGKTIVLGNDIDLAGKTWTPIGGVVSYPSVTFAGTFDGNNKTILNMNADDSTANYAASGLFGTITGVVKNVTLKDVTVTSTHYAGGLVGYSSAQDGIRIENCHVNGGSITSTPELIGASYDNGDKVGGIIGYCVAKDVVTGCTVEDITITAYRDLGGIAGCAAGNITGCEVGDNVKLIVNSVNNYKNYTTSAAFNANSVVGRSESGIRIENCTGTATVSFLNGEAAIDDIQYFTLAGAIAAAEDGDTVTLLKDVADNIIIPAGKAIILDLNGKTLTGGPVVDGGTLTVQDSGTNGKIVDANDYGIFCKNGGTAIIKSGTVSSKYAALSGNNTTGNMNFVVNGGILTAKEGPAIYMPGQVSLTVTDGVLNGGISLRMGQINITGGTINAITDNIDSPAEYYDYSGNAWFPDALYVFGGTYNSGDDKYGNSLNINITGGTFNCENNQGSAVAIYDIGKVAQDMEVNISGDAILTNKASSDRGSYQVLSLEDIGVTDPKTNYGNAEYTGKVTSSITGGTFSSNPSAYKDESTIVRINDGATYTVVTNSNLKSGTYLTIPSVASGYRYTGSEGAYVVSRIPSSSNDSSNANTETTKNPDGSTTTTTTDKATGTVTETTKDTDGTTTTVETQKDGTVTETVKTPEGTTGTVVTDKDGDITEIKAAVTSAAVSAAEKSGEAVTLPVEVPAAASTEAAPAVEITVPKASGSVKVEIPVEQVTPGTVAVIVKADGTEEIVKTSVLTEDGVALTLDDSATVKIIDNAKDFGDTNGHWAEDAISFVSAREIFTGTSTTTFTPNAPMTRAQLMTVLASFDGQDTTGGSVWYEKGMEWAVANGVSDGSDPNGSITREQLATMLWRYAGSPVVEGGIDSFHDAGDVSGYAADAMRWAVEIGLISGVGDNTLDPQGNATRAQLAVILMNYCGNLTK